ncbi:MAG: Histidinol-phosphate aminotransferase 2 [Candidatus Omnitrophica bacterium ADurb.Bin292]|jgi:histidinol-phosphate aminotransferase|nr:MAG: Histidinol-phosphate aminotransferase 2 [Candidatus Omnitrophica bacterium ADurb.Bin292]HPW77118.1 histidinol-phosphate transaminase [Candidatus Omnitrophota bacterium]HQB12273.1 histidinol-phosphate transaminase [Candidatus Omnitrophota bacterium]
MIPFKKHIQDIRPYEPGKPIRELQREYGIRNVTKLASNENPLGRPSTKAMRAMRKAIREVHLYPEGSCHYIAERLSRELDLPTDQIIFGNGSNEIIELVGRGFLSEGDEVISSEMSFLVYPILTQVCGGRFQAVPVTRDYRCDLPGILARVTPKTKVIFIANPNNPTGTYVTAQEMEAFLAKVPPHVIVCLDEAYVDFVDAGDFPKMLNYVREGRPNLVVIRTFSKAYGLAGLRIGYAAASKEMVAYLHKIRQPFNVNSVAQAAAVATLDDKFFLWKTKWMVARGRKYFYRQFKRLGLEYLPSQANFILLNLKKDGNEVFQELLRSGMIVRAMGAYKLPTWIRVTIGRRSENAQLIRLLKTNLENNQSS